MSKKDDGIQELAKLRESPCKHGENAWACLMRSECREEADALTRYLLAENETLRVAAGALRNSLVASSEVEGKMTTRDAIRAELLEQALVRLKLADKLAAFPQRHQPNCLPDKRPSEWCEGCARDAYLAAQKDDGS